MHTLLSLLLLVPAIAVAQAPSPALRDAVAAASRSPENVARDRYRHPAETLAFFGVRPGDTVVEIWPAGGWYTEILAPYLAKGGGTLIAAAGPGYYLAATTKKLDSDPALYGRVVRTNFPKTFGGSPVAPGTADVVLTFRNVHNWRMGWQSPDKADYSASAFAEMFAMLKPGGVLGIEDHRLPETADTAQETSSGYLKVSTVRRLAEAAGFRFAGGSEVNANPRDTKDYPNGVWSLPPALQEKDKDRAKYLAIGESDRMTLKFVKPK